MCMCACVPVCLRACVPACARVPVRARAFAGVCGAVCLGVFWRKTSLCVQLVPGDASSVFTGNMSYACNLTTGGVTYRQNLLVSFVDPADPNSTMTVSANLSISAAGCTGRAGVHVNYTIGVEYPLSFWEAFTAPDTTVGRFLDPNLKRSMLVVNGTTFTDMDPEFSLATLAAMAGEGVACNAPPPPGPVPVGAPAPPDCAQNVSGLLAQTGTDITFKLKSIEGSSQAQKSTPGVAFGMSATISVLSQKNSKICAGEDAFCCATFDKDGKCCCNPDEISAFCGSDANTFVSAQCSSDTGQTKQCSDAVCPVVNAKDDCTKNPSLFRSECAAFKLSVYNFTMGLPTSGAPTGGARVDVFPSDPVSSVVEFDLLEYFYGELCVHGNDCPGQETTGKAWLSGDRTGGAKPPGVVKIGPNANGEIGDCDGAINRCGCVTAPPPSARARVPDCGVGYEQAAAPRGGGWVCVLDAGSHRPTGGLGLRRLFAVPEAPAGEAVPQSGRQPGRGDQ